MNRWISIAAFGVLFFTACQRKDTPNKFIDTLPIDTTVTVVPGIAAKQMILLKNVGLTIAIPVMNRLGQAGSTFPELQGPDINTRYSFSYSDATLGTVTFTLQFRDTNDQVIDPIANVVSTNTLKGAVFAATGQSPGFSYTENLEIILETSGIADSDKSLTGTSHFVGAGYDITFTFPAPGVVASFNGLTKGRVTASGTGGPSSLPMTMNLTFSSDHQGNGDIAWDGLQGKIHTNDNGTGVIVTNQARYLID